MNDVSSDIVYLTSVPIMKQWMWYAMLMSLIMPYVVIISLASYSYYRSR